jgi:hypothetical protein
MLPAISAGFRQPRELFNSTTDMHQLASTTELVIEPETESPNHMVRAAVLNLPLAVPPPHQLI